MVGAGAAGLMAALTAADGSTPVVIVERTGDGGRKILVSGGGRCNVLPSIAAPERFVTGSPPALMRRLLRAWPLAAQRRFFEEEAGIPLALEADTGKLFPASNRARDVRDGLLALARSRGVTVRFGTTVTALTPVAAGPATGAAEPEAAQRGGTAWCVDTTAGPVAASRVILATGGLSVPATGSDGTGLRVAADLGHDVHETYPALTPLTGDAANLAGISLPVRLRGRWPPDGSGRVIEARGGFLFTHRGYSGPSVLDLSHVAVRSTRRADAAIRVSWSAHAAADWERDLAGPDVQVVSVVARQLPDRLAAFLVADAGIPPGRRTSALRREERIRLIDRLTAWELPWTGHEGYKKAEVTGGGVALTEVDPRTLESRHHPGLYLCGEMLDAFGPIGGHNFSWAWSTGRTAGRAAM